MNDTKRLSTLRAMIGDSDNPTDETLTVYLSLAVNAVMNRLYPFGWEDKHLPSKYDLKACEIACYLYNKRGAEGQTGHSENGISRSYESASVPESMLKEITPFVGVIK
jgi:hypothetical protein